MPAEAVQTYFEEYAANFSLLECIKFKTEVMKVSSLKGKHPKFQADAVFMEMQSFA